MTDQAPKLALLSIGARQGRLVSLDIPSEQILKVSWRVEKLST